MATLRIPIIGPGVRLDDAGNVRFETMQGSVWTGGTIDEFISVYPDTDTTDYLFGSFKVPENYSSATTDPAIVIPWVINDTSTNNVVFDFDYFAVADGEDVDRAYVENATVTDAGPGTAGLIQSAIATLTRANLVANDIVRFQVGRDSANASDTLEAIDVYVKYTQIVFRYADA